MKIHSLNRNPSNNWWTAQMDYKLEMGQSWRELTWDVWMASLMFILSGSRQLRFLIRILKTILFAQMNLQGSAPIIYMALTISTTS